MNPAALNDLWNSPDNRPPAEAGDRLAAPFIASLRRRRRVQALWLAWTFLALAITTALVATQIVTRGVAVLAGQSGLWPMLALPWFAALFFLRRFWREGRTIHPRPSSLHATLVAARAANRSERRRVKTVGVLQAAMLPVTAISVWQLHLAGKASAEQAWSMAFVFGVAFAIGGGFALWRYQGHLVPERHRIEALLHELERPESS